MKQEVKEAADELLADIRHTLAWAAREYGVEEMEALRMVLREAIEPATQGGATACGEAGA